MLIINQCSSRFQHLFNTQGLTKDAKCQCDRCKRGRVCPPKIWSARGVSWNESGRSGMDATESTIDEEFLEQGGGCSPTYLLAEARLGCRWPALLDDSGWQRYYAERDGLAEWVELQLNGCPTYAPMHHKGFGYVLSALCLLRHRFFLTNCFTINIKDKHHYLCVHGIVFLLDRMHLTKELKIAWKWPIINIDNWLPSFGNRLQSLK